MTIASDISFQRALRGLLGAATMSCVVVSTAGCESVPPPAAVDDEALYADGGTLPEKNGCGRISLASERDRGGAGGGMHHPDCTGSAPYRPDIRGNGGVDRSCNDRCSASCPCDEGEGDCDRDIDCKGNLVCPPNGPGAEYCEAPVGDGSSTQGTIQVVGTTTAKNQRGDMDIQVPAAARAGDLLLLFVHRTDGPNIWSGAPEGFARTPVQCAIDNSARVQDFDCRGQRNDLNQVMFYREADESDSGSSYAIDMSGTKPAWAIMAAVRGASTDSPVRAWAGQTRKDGKAGSRFPSVSGAQAGDLLLLSQSFDDGADSSNDAAWNVKSDSFLAPSGFTRHGFVIDRDEAGHLFGRVLSSSGSTGEPITKGPGTAGYNKDANLSVVIRADN